MPPPELRALIGRPDPDLFAGTDADSQAFDLVPPSCFESVLDFGCGCGRIARMLLSEQGPRRPKRYLGIDLHRGMVTWCRQNLEPLDPAFSFKHHDAFSQCFNPRARASTLPFPAGDGEFSLVLAYSVFTHLPQREAEHYLAEVGRVLRPDGALLATFFFFDRALFPMLQPFQHALYVNQDDLSNAVIFSREWLLGQLAQHGLVATRVIAPGIRGYQWMLLIRPIAAGDEPAEWPVDDAPIGHEAPPLAPVGAERLGDARPRA